MAHNLTVAEDVRNAALDAGIGDVADSGKLRIYSGMQPASPDDGIGGAVLLVELTMNAAAFPPASGGILTAAAITDGAAIVDGIAAWFRLWQSDGTTPLVDGTVGTSGCDLNLNSVNLIETGNVNVESLTLTFPAESPC
jgi:hypothetical protein